MKIDTTKIAGYADMSAEDKVKALEAFEHDDMTAEVERYKNAASKANTEAAEWRRKHNSLLSEEQQKQLEREESEKSMKTQLDALLKDKSVSDERAYRLSLGYDEKLAAETAEAFVDGNVAKVRENERKFLEAKEKSIKDQLLKDTPRPLAPAAAPASADYEKQLQTAYDNNDMATVAFLMRQQQEATKK